MIQRPWGVTVYGAASVKAQPDLVRVRFRVVRLEQTPPEAFQAASAAVRTVRSALRAHGVADAAVDGSRLDLKTAWKYQSNTRTFAGYECSAAFALESTNLNDVEPLLVDLVAAGANEVD
ncbi:SIMPL domain-containing protein, partial [Asanoa sp. NPDC050611]|uniref:SIMPL domain-containing protein n=1 Tax=Asanoa sp. NPDC050611 TaxID=3157098 RepID=UPI0033EA3BBF